MIFTITVRVVFHITFRLYGYRSRGNIKGLAGGPNKEMRSISRADKLWVEAVELVPGRLITAIYSVVLTKYTLYVV
jgi:hypothetical protein